MHEYLNILLDKNNLSYNQASDAMTEIMSGRATDAQIAAFLTSLRMKGESIDEIAACADVMRSHAIRIEGDNLIDVVGTGGDCANTFNVSTTAAFVTAGAGAKVAKHGNRSVSSKCGAADVLEALGIKIDLSPDKNQIVLDSIGMCFMFAPLYHKSMKYVMTARKQLAFRTIFNILGPLSNPARADIVLLGVYDKELLRPMASVLQKLGMKRAMTVWGHDGIDEISINAKTSICEVKDGELHEYTIEPATLGLTGSHINSIDGGTPETNARITLDILSGEKGAKRDIVIANSAAAIYIAGKANSLEEAAQLAELSIDGGKALEKLERLKQLTNEVA